MGETELVASAKQGDSEAAAEIITSHLPYWMGAARQMIATDSRGLRAGGPLTEPAELVQEAMLKLLEQWRQGQGPESNPRSYVTSIMRHSYANKFRSPRTLERSLDSLDYERPLTVTDNVSHVDISRETAIMRRALRSLMPDHRAVLLAVTVEGKKPSEVAEQLERPAAAVSNLLARAKHALFRRVLIEHLSQGGSECRENAENLPRRVHEYPDLHADKDQGMGHVRECQRCQRNWRRFATILSAFGLLPLVLVTDLVGGGVSAAAYDEHLPEEPTAGRVARALSSKAVLGIGLVCLVVSVLALAGHAIFGTWQGEEVVYSGELAEKNPYEAGFDVTLHTDDNGALHAISADFTVREGTNWEIHQVTLELAPGTEFRLASHGLDCTTSGTLTVCDPGTAGSLAGPFVFEVDNPAHGGSFLLDLIVKIDGDIGHGRAAGQWWVRCPDKEPWCTR